MADSLSDLEKRRAAIQSEVAQLGDMRAGSISDTRGCCGNPNCHCHRPADPGHGPYPRLTRKLDGKTVTETLSSPGAVAKARREVTEYHRFRELGGQLLAVNEEICRLRPVEEPAASAGEKNDRNHPPRGRARSRPGLAVIFAGHQKTGAWDLEAVEMAMRTAMHQAGAVALSELLKFPAPATGQRALPCECGRQARYRELRSKPLLTAVGEVLISRPYYLCPHCHRGQFPADVELDIQNTEFSPGVRRMKAMAGQEVPFDHVRQQLKLLADLEVTTKAVERTTEAVGQDIAVGQQTEMERALQLDLPMAVAESIPVLYVEMDGTGVPVVKAETEGRTGKSEGQPAHTREAKLGCVFTQTTWDPEGYPIRDLDSTTYAGAIETAEQFGKRIYLEAWRRGWSRAEQKIVIGDGAEWIWNLAQEHFPEAVQIVDLFHARQHLWELSRRLYPTDRPRQNRWIMIQQNRLDGGKIDKLVAALRSI